MTEKDLVEGMAEYAQQDLSKALSLTADMLIALWERSEELPDVYDRLEMANQVIEAFCKHAGEEGFSYELADFKAVEQFVSQGDEYDTRGDQTSQQE